VVSEASVDKWGAWLRRNGFGDLFGVGEQQAHRFDELIWQPADADRLASWQLYTELRTRIATQPLAYRSGDEEAALDSVYQLFELSRRTIRAYPGCFHFATLLTEVLNIQVRPFTARWHRMRVDGRLASADVRFSFRRQLGELQVKLRTFARLLGVLAQDPTIGAENDLERGSDAQSTTRLWERVCFGIDRNGIAGRDPDGINTHESTEIAKRRRLYGLPNAGEPTDAVGLALSGGGIRSATFGLGVVQALSRKGILRQVDYLSTVSGGGYLGGFVSSFLNDRNEAVNLQPEDEALPFGGENSRESTGIRHLRNHSKYLSEGGFRTASVIVGQITYGMLVSVLVLSPLIFLAALVTRISSGELLTNEAQSWVTWRITKVALFALAFAVLLLPVTQNWVKYTVVQSAWGWFCRVLGAVTLVLLLCQAFPYLFRSIEQIGGAKVVLAGTLAVPLVAGVLGLWLGTKSLPGQVALSLFVAVGPLLLLSLFVWVCELFVVPSAQFGMNCLLLVTIGSFLYATFFLNINFASPHRFYRERLARTYMTRADIDSGTVSCVDPQALSQMNADGKAPYHLVNAALNIPNCDDPNLRGRNTDFFLFSKHFCGSPIVGFDPTRDWEAMDRHLDLGTAMAISGAAAAPHMGTLTSSRFTFLLAMLNVRLGYWALRPSIRAKAILKYMPPVGWYYFARELTGLMSEKTNYLNLSDGGHIENLGIYELLRRRCKFIIAVDGEADPQLSFAGLLKLTQYAFVDLGVRIEPDLNDLRKDRDGWGRAHFGLSRIEYPGGDYGLLLYIKSSLTGNESEFLRRYHADNPTFPHQSTAQQLFSEAQFEAYRSLGEHVASDLFRSDLMGEWRSDLTIREFFFRLATTLLGV
jgi:Patatin-like phospholipase